MMLYVYIGLAATPTLVGSQSLQLATRFDSQLAVRAEFYGGYALVAPTCPSDTKKCSTGLCCPADKFCIVSTYYVVCCPDENDCFNQINALPACGDPSWGLFTGAGAIWCCLPGQVGVYNNGQWGQFVCGNSNLDIPTSKLATRVSQIGEATTTPSTRTVAAIPTETNKTNAKVTGTTSMPYTTITRGSGRTSDISSNPPPSPSTSMKLSAGAIAGITIGAVIAVLLMIFLSWIFYSHGKQRATKKQLHQMENPPQYSAYSVPNPAPQVSNNWAASPLQPEHRALDNQRALEIDSRTGTGCRAELGH